MFMKHGGVTHSYFFCTPRELLLYLKEGRCSAGSFLTGHKTKTVVKGTYLSACQAVVTFNGGILCFTSPVGARHLSSNAQR